MDKNKVAVLTLINSVNYGGTLQAIALNDILKSEGKEILYIKYGKDWNAFVNPVRFYKQLISFYGNQQIKTRIKALVKSVLSQSGNLTYLKKKKRYHRYYQYIRSNINLSQEFLSFDELKDYKFDCGTFIVGSDQVWNAKVMFSERLDPVYMLEFAPDDAKRIAYAVSVGGTKSKEELTYLYCFAKNFDAVSVREKSLEESFVDLGLINCRTVLDPTLLLSAEQWQKYEKNPGMEEDYYLVYSLEYSEDIAEKIYILSGGKNKVIDISPGNYYRKTKCTHIMLNTPDEFLYMIHHAKGVITNSFHGTIFSIIYEKQFLTVSREGQEARTYDLLAMLHLLDRLDVKDEEIADIMEKKINYIQVMDILNEQKRRSLNFLKDNLD